MYTWLTTPRSTCNGSRPNFQILLRLRSQRPYWLTLVMVTPWILTPLFPTYNRLALLTITTPNLWSFHVAPLIGLMNNLRVFMWATWPLTSMTMFWFTIRWISIQPNGWPGLLITVRSWRASSPAHFMFVSPLVQALTLQVCHRPQCLHLLSLANHPFTCLHKQRFKTVVKKIFASTVMRSLLQTTSTSHDWRGLGRFWRIVWECHYPRSCTWYTHEFPLPRGVWTFSYHLRPHRLSLFTYNAPSGVHWQIGAYGFHQYRLHPQFVKPNRQAIGPYYWLFSTTQADPSCQ